MFSCWQFAIEILQTNSVNRFAKCHSFYTYIQKERLQGRSAGLRTAPLPGSTLCPYSNFEDTLKILLKKTFVGWLAGWLGALPLQHPSLKRILDPPLYQYIYQGYIAVTGQHLMIICILPGLQNIYVLFAFIVLGECKDLSSTCNKKKHCHMFSPMKSRCVKTCTGCS